MLLLLLLLLCLQTSLQQTSRCDIAQREDVTTSCTSCAAAVNSRCPKGFTPVKGRPNNCSYSVQIGGRSHELQGCRLNCAKNYMAPACCQQYWGPLCLPCPTWSGRTCNFRGTCVDGDKGNGTCVCDEGFAGFACQECRNKKTFGENCDKACDCVHGSCNNGPEGDGKCLCEPPYTGRRCDQESSRCTNCSPYSHCKGEGDSAYCECLPGYRKTTKNKCSSVCSQRDCDVNAACTSQGSRITCTCKADYEGDGRVCVPKNPCSVNNGGCPINSTVCVFKGPNKSGCQCMFGMSAIVGGAPELGCQLVSACRGDTCDPSAACETGLDGHPRCTCKASQIGDGRRCYGNLMERILDLNVDGEQRGELTGTVFLFGKSCLRLFSHNGPFTAFIPLMKTSPTSINSAERSQGIKEESLCKNHLILGQHLYKDLEGPDFNLFGGARLRTKENKRFILIEDPSRVYTVIKEDLPAANGVIHIIDKLITSPALDGSTRDQQFSDKTIAEILTKDERFNRFLSLVDNCGSPPPLRGPGPLTVFVPTNQAVDNARDGSILYMLNDAKHKLQELLRNHVYSKAVLTVDGLIALEQIQTMANEKVTVSVSENGDVLLGQKGVRMTLTNIMASNGIIHMIDGLLYPPSILPILPHRCDVVSNYTTDGPCVHCSFLDETECPIGTTEMMDHKLGCEYVSSPFMSDRVSKGCSKRCKTIKKVAECCPGFYGPDCKPCIGGFQHPCYDKGKCSDGINGNGSCSCKPGLTGVACHICADPSKHGENCDEDCRCVHGVCDNRPGSKGVCRRASCLEEYSGEYCDKKATACNADGLLEHCHMHAYCTQSGLTTTCVCRDGYEGDGHACSPVNPCLRSSRGGCDANAECVYVGPGSVSCVCSEGWSGDGTVCVEINNCQLATRGGCSANANCIHIGPGQSGCVCKTGFMGNGVLCDRVNPCSVINGGCHFLAQCAANEDGSRNCTCPDGFAGNGETCYGTILDTLETNPKLFSFYLKAQAVRFSQDVSGNVTLLVPSFRALTNMTAADEVFWMHRHRRPYFLRAHVLDGVYSVEDLDRLVGTKVPTIHPQTQWEITNSSGVIRIGSAAITSHNLQATNGFIHIIDKVLAPSRLDIPPLPPNLMAFLNSTSNYALFRQSALLHNLSGSLGNSDFTLLLPSDEAVRQHFKETNTTILDARVLMYHVIPRQMLHPDHIGDGMLKHTLLGDEFQVQFHLNDNNQTFVNDVLINGTFLETDNGVLIPIPQVLKVRQNRCGKPVSLQVNGRCSDCEGAPRCTFTYKPIKPEFPSRMRSNCRYRKRIGSRRISVPGCVINCLRHTRDLSCCPGYYGHECFKCPGEVGNWCSNHGECQDGNYGNGECRCYEGFHGTACEDCEPGRYGVNCSSKCVCNHGKCEDGLTGSGKCVCYKGWRGTSCSVEIKDDSCGGVCDENANCITGPKGSAAACLCVAGYEGNGTYCKELDLCSRSNGGCAEFATCERVSAGERTCTCKQGYTGDGVVCLEIDGCLLNNGGCHKSAECIRAGPNLTSCKCKMGFQGSGRFCFPANPCRSDNGGCSNYARCEYLGKGVRNCTCKRGYMGDGFDCRGSTNTELSRQQENASIRKMISATKNSVLFGDGPFTVFSPMEDSSPAINEWRQDGRLNDLLQSHIVTCETLTLSDLKTTTRVVSLSGYELHFSLQQGSVVINNSSKIVSSDYVTTNGIIHRVDKLVTPYRLQDKPSRSNADRLDFPKAVVYNGYTRFYKLVQDAGLLPVLSMTIHQPFTVFCPTNKALDSLPPERWRWLTSPDHHEQLVATVKAHIVRSSKLLNVAQPSKSLTYRTMHGSTIKFSCDKSLVGAVVLNDHAATLVERNVQFSGGVAYGIDQLLEPPGLGAFCDEIENVTTHGRCGKCRITPRCPYRHTDMGTKQACFNMRSRYGSGLGRFYSDLDDHFSGMGCKRVCQQQKWTQKCCKNHYGRDCQVCPGGVEAPCDLHGNCDDGIRGSGACNCHDGFRGSACELCAKGFYGLNCTACSCEEGRCDDGKEGSGQCVCKQGWAGVRCDIHLASIPEECKRCHAQADCVAGVGCQCRPGFEGNGTVCEPVPPPDLCAEYNGGCDQNAACNQTGSTVNCTCRLGYQGDGYACSPINRCVEEANGGCSDFASCQFTGPNERECECLPGYVGNGVQCLEKVVPPVDRCLEENGGCDPAASCKDLHYHANTAGVFHLRSPDGKYKMNFSQADAACQAEGATLASFKQLGDAQQLGMHLCVAGWMEGGKVGYPTQFPSVRCGDNHVGLVIYREPVDQSSTYDAYCYRLKDVSCSCPDEYVGNGDFCNGVLTSVLASYNNFSIFYKLLLNYSTSSLPGKQFIDVLSDRKSLFTLFVPHNAGFGRNQTLSARDLQYHVTTNNCRRPFKALKHKEGIKSWLGFNLTVTHDAAESRKLVNKRLLVEWDIPAVNGIIHVIDAPLSAPPPLISHDASRRHAHSSGAASAILVSLFLACVLAALGYYVFKHKTDAFRFHYFRNEDEDGATSGSSKPTLVSIPNPLYSGARAHAEPFGDNINQAVEPAEPEEPPKILDLDLDLDQ